MKRQRKPGRIKKQPHRTFPYEAHYVGAPYNDAMEGQLISRHATHAAAISARYALQWQVKYYGSNTRIIYRTPDGEATGL